MLDKKFPEALNQSDYTYSLEGIYNSKAEAHAKFTELKRHDIPDDSKMRTLKKGDQVALYIW